MSSRRKRSIVYVTKDENGTVDRVAIPMRYVYVFVAAAITGMFTFAGLAGSYTRMLVKTESVNKLRQELAMTRTDYAHLEKKEHEKDVQVASLGSLASEVSAIYGLTAGKLTLPHGHFGTKKPVVDPKAPLKDDTAVSGRAKVAVSEALFRVADRCVQVMGGAGVTGDSPVQQIFRDIRAFRIYDGPSEVHRWSIAKRIKATHRATLAGH